MPRFNERSVGILAPGQGSQFAGMGEELYKSSDTAKMVFHEASEASGTDIAEACFGSQTELLSDTRIAQPAITAVSLANYLHAREGGFLADAGKGHSAGELAILGAAGILTVRETMDLMVKRAEITHQAAQDRPGRMFAVSHLSREQLQELIDNLPENVKELAQQGRIGIANWNTKRQNTLTGDENLLQHVRQALKVMRVKEKMHNLKFGFLSVGGAFHSKWHMADAVEPYYEAAARYEYKEPEFYVMLNNSRYVHELGTDNLPRYLADQLVNGVDFVGGIERLYMDGLRRLVDIGDRKQDALTGVTGDLVLEDYGDEIEVRNIADVELDFSGSFS